MKGRAEELLQSSCVFRAGKLWALSVLNATVSVMLQRIKCYCACVYCSFVLGATLRCLLAGSGRAAHIQGRSPGSTVSCTVHFMYSSFRAPLILCGFIGTHISREGVLKHKWTTAQNRIAQQRGCNTQSWATSLR
eukprot:scaffold63004_cov19-Tisochrysis_lutea.AAC.1